MATRTFLQLVEAIADSLQLRVPGTSTAVGTTAVTAANYPFQTNRANASAKAYEGDELYVTSGTPPVPNPNGVSAYAPATGVLTPSVTYSQAPSANVVTFDVFTRGVSITDIRAAINDALRNLRYRTIVPLTLVNDGDMDASGTSAYTASNATLSKVTGAGNELRGASALRVLATAATGYAQSGTVFVDPTFEPSYYVQAKVRADVGTARLIAWDVTNGALIASGDWAIRGWGILDFQFQLPATCQALAFRLESLANNDDTYWDDLMALPMGAQEVALPSWVIRADQVRWVWNGVQDLDQADRPYYQDEPWWRVLPDESNPNSMFKLSLGRPMFGPVWIEASRGFSELAVDADTTFCDREWIELAGSVELLKRLSQRSPSQDTTAWAAEYKTRLSQLKGMNGMRMPRRLLKVRISSPLNPDWNAPSSGISPWPGGVS